jgi:hypothetical protein
MHWIVAFDSGERFFRLRGSEQSTRLAGELRNFVLPNNVNAERILPFAALVLPAQEAMLYLIHAFARYARACRPRRGALNDQRFEVVGSDRAD